MVDATGAEHNVVWIEEGWPLPQREGDELEIWSVHYGVLWERNMMVSALYLRLDQRVMRGHEWSKCLSSDESDLTVATYGQQQQHQERIQSIGAASVRVGAMKHGSHSCVRRESPSCLQADRFRRRAISIALDA